MKNLFANDYVNHEVDYLGVELTPKEASLVSKILGSMSFYQRNEILSLEEEELCTKLYVELRA